MYAVLVLSAVCPAASIADSSLLRGAGWAVALPDRRPTRDDLDPVFPGRAWYVDDTAGDDTGPGTREHPWRTLARATTTAFGAGDALLLKCGGIWRETLTLNKRVAGAGNLVVGGWGDCSADQLPSLRGSDLVAADGWMRADSLPVGTFVNRLANPATPIFAMFADGRPIARARYPSDGGIGRQFAALARGSTKTMLTLQPAERSYIGSRNIVGATVHVRTEPWRIETGTIVAYDAVQGVLALQRALSRAPVEGSGLILEGKPWMLDSAGGWAWDAGQLYVRLPGDVSPTTRRIEASTRENVIAIGGIDRVRLRGLEITQAGRVGVTANSVSDLDLAGLRVLYAGEYGFRLTGTQGAKIVGSRIEGAGYVGLYLEGREGRVARNELIDHGLTARAGGADAAISVEGDAMIVQNNSIVRASHIGIRFANARADVVANNVVVQACARLTDCGGIYTYTGVDSAAARASDERRTLVQDNVVVGSTGNLDGTSGRGGDRATGIYLDEGSKSVQVIGNRIAGMDLGVFLHNAANNTIGGNWIWGVRHAAVSAHQSRSDLEVLRGNRITGNHLQSDADPRDTGRRASVFALEWHHPTRPENFFDGDNANSIEGNQLLGDPGAPATMAWYLRTDGKPAVRLGPTQWRAFAPRDRVLQPPADVEPATGTLIINASDTMLRSACSLLALSNCDLIGEEGKPSSGPDILEPGQALLAFARGPR